MSRWTETWLSGTPGAGGDGAEQDYRGQRLGLPERGSGSVADFGQRFAALLIDWMPCYVAALLFTTNPQFSALALFAALTVVSISLTGRSPGHALMGLRVALLNGCPAGFSAAVIRTVLLCLVIPAVVYNSDGRGLHDRAAGTIVLRAR